MTVCDSFTFGAVPLTNSAWHSLGFRNLPVGWATVTFTIENAVAGTGPHGPCDNYVEWKNGSGGLIVTDHIGNVASGATASFVLTPPPTTTNWNVISTPGAVDNSNAITLGIVVDCGTGGTVYCAYGVEPNPAASIITVVTSAVVDIAIAVLGGGPLMILAFDTLIGAPLILGDLCSQPPPAVPTFGPDDFIAGTQVWSPGSFPKRMQALRAAVWGFYCQCIPASGGNPPAIDFPAPPMLTDPTATGGAPTLVVCDSGDLCASINAIMRQLAAMNAQLTYARTDIQLIQRQQVPFAYVPGALHSGLTGAGQFVVQAILGLSVTSTVVPPWLSASMAPVNSWFRLGEIAYGTINGWVRRQLVTHNPHLLLDVPGDVTLVAYLFEPGVTANILELLREP